MTLQFLYENLVSNDFCENSVVIKISVISQTYARVVHVIRKGFFCKKLFFLPLKFPEKITDKYGKSIKNNKVN